MREGAGVSGSGSISIPEALARLVAGQDLGRGEARAVIGQVMEGEATPAQIGALLMALRMKGESVAEVAGAADAMRAAATPVRTARRPLLDTCGTGGDGQGSFNISTAAGLLAAACGVAVAKHGNRSVSSRCGSADVLEAAGVRIDLTADQMGHCLDEVGFAFLYAPALHRAMRHAIGPRREIRLRTIFNLLGPLTNPAGAQIQLLGAFDLPRARLLAEVLRELGGTRAWVVHGLDGSDELTVGEESAVFAVGATSAADGAAAEIEERRLAPEDAGLPRSPGGVPAGADPLENARWLRELLAGERRDATRDMVLLNTAAALHLAGAANSVGEGRALAEDALADGRGFRLLEELIRVTQSL